MVRRTCSAISRLRRASRYFTSCARHLLALHLAAYEILLLSDERDLGVVFPDPDRFAISSSAATSSRRSALGKALLGSETWATRGSTGDLRRPSAHADPARLPAGEFFHAGRARD